MYKLILSWNFDKIDKGKKWACSITGTVLVWSDEVLSGDNAMSTWTAKWDSIVSDKI